MLNASQYARIQQKRKLRERIDFAAFAELIATPATITTVAGVTLPANAALYVSIANTTLVNKHVLEVGPRTISVPSLGANHYWPIGSFERGRTLKLSAAVGTVVSVYMQDGAGKLHKIAEG
jgi:hypothetical protein